MPLVREREVPLVGRGLDIEGAAQYRVHQKVSGPLNPRIGKEEFQLLEKKWSIEKCALVTHWYAGMRSVRIYEFTLNKDGRTVVMPVLDNPYVERFIIEEGIDLIKEADAMA